MNLSEGAAQEMQLLEATLQSGRVTLSIQPDFFIEAGNFF
jgi:hypothetical protein